MLNVIMLFGLFGILDDMIDIGRPAKLVLMYYCSYPLMQYATHTQTVFPVLGNIEFGIFYIQLIVPTFVLVAANLVNMLLLLVQHLVFIFSNAILQGYSGEMWDH
jgi:UDP-N-acetylglucosamine--dolichyl-phosphate N-acetylglucosaminephosphotransferase